MGMLIWLVSLLLELYFWVIILTVLVSWLVAFGVLNTRNKWVYKFCEFLNRLTNPVMIPLRRVIPVIAGIDITPMVAIFGIYILQRLLWMI